MSVLELLDREWARLGADPAAARRLVDVCAVAGGAGTLADVERYVRAAGPVEADAVLVALVARAVEGDDLAARVLLQLLLPGVRRLARTWWALGDAEERAAAAVAAVYDRIRRYPIARRPRRVATNVLMDAASDLRRVVRSSRVTAGSRPLAGWGSSDGSASGSGSGSGDGWFGGRLDGGFPAGWEPVDRPVPHPAVELADALCDAVEAGVVSAGDAELIAASRIAGVPLAEIAARRGAKLRTLQWRRKRAEASLAGASATAAA